MQLDVRLPMGIMFFIIGLILVVYGLVTAWTNAAMYDRSLGYNVNIWWGLFLTAFGVLMLWLTKRAAPSAPEPRD